MITTSATADLLVINVDDEVPSTTELVEIDQEPVSSDVGKEVANVNDLPTWLELLKDAMKVNCVDIDHAINFCTRGRCKTTKYRVCLA